jgi:hypothetical protein
MFVLIYTYYIQKGEMKMNIVGIYSERNGVSLYYAATPIKDNEQVTIIEYIYETEEEAIESGFDYDVATWRNINDLANSGYFSNGRILITPQGKFVGECIYESEEEGAWDAPSRCVYRSYGAPVAFSEAVEYHLFWNVGSELVSAIETRGMFEAIIRNQNGESVVIRS